MADEEAYTSGYHCPHCKQAVDPTSAVRLDEPVGKSNLPPVPGSRPASRQQLPPVPGSSMAPASQLPPVPSAAQSGTPSSSSRQSASRPKANPSSGIHPGVIIGGIVVLLMIFGFFSGRNSSSPDRAITRVLERCAEISRQASLRFQNNAAAQAEFVAMEFQKVDLSKCPPDFRMAYQQHVNAWREAGPYLGANNSLNHFIEGFYSGFTGDTSSLGISNYNAQVAFENINGSYYQLVNIAAAYGAKIPNSVVQ